MKKILVLLISIMAVFGCVSFTGCAKSNELIVATSADFAPWEYIENNEFAGIDMELAKLIAGELNMKLKVSNMNFDSVVTSVQNKESSLAMSGLTINAERAKMINFSNPYYDVSQYLIVKSTNTDFDGLTTKAAVDDKVNSLTNTAKIGFQNGTTGEFYAKGNEELEYAGYANAVKNGYDNGALAVTDLINGNINIVVIDNLTAIELVNANPGTKMINIPLTEEQYGIGVNKDDTELLAKVNAALAKFKENGKLQEIFDKYLTD